MTRLDEILAPARAIAGPAKAAPVPGELAPPCEALPPIGFSTSRRTYYRRRDGLVTAKKWRTVESEYPFNGTSWDLVDTCRARTVPEAAAIFAGRPRETPCEPVKIGGRHA